MTHTSNPQTRINKRPLPKDWQWVKLRDLLTSLETGSRPKGGAQGITSGVPSLSAEHMTRFGTFDFSDLRFVPREFYEQMPKGHIKRNDILIVKDGATTGKTVFIDQTFPYPEAVINEHVFLCRPDLEKANPLYLFYFLWSPVGLIQIRQNFQGAAIGGINQSFTEKVIIPLPPLDEQRRIANRLDEQLSVVKSARKAAEEQLEAARQLPSVYLQELFGDSAKHKRNWQKLGDVCELLPSKTIKSIGDTVVTAITTACLSENGFLPAGLKTSRMDANDAKQALVREGEILIARSNTPDLVGRVSIYLGNPPNVVASDLTIRIWASSACHPPFLTAYLSYLYLNGYWKEMAGGASGSMKKITRTQVLNVKIPVPDIESQKKTVAEMKSKMDNFRQLAQSLESQLAEINRLPASLLREAFAGQL